MNTTIRQRQHTNFYIFLFPILFVSCASYKSYLPVPDYDKYTITYNLTMQNMDNEGICDLTSWNVTYNDFSVRYTINNDKKLVLEIDNKSNKTLILDKAKCYVLINGYSNELFKDIRSGRSTTYGNVLDAINNVQTNENSVTLQIPPYSRWTLPLSECNVPDVPLPESQAEKTYSVYDAAGTVEYILTYTFDYTLAKWSTSRNRIWVEKVTRNIGKSSNQIEELISIDRNTISISRTVTTPERQSAIRENDRRRAHNASVAESEMKWEMVGNALLASLIAGAVGFGILYLALSL